MNRRRSWYLLTSAILAGGLTSCCGTSGYRSSYFAVPRSAVVPTCAACGNGGPQPPRFNPAPGVPAPIPPGGGGIQQSTFVPSGPPGSPLPSGSPLPPGGAPGVSLGAPEPVAPSGQPLPSGPASPSDATRQYPPQTPEPPQAPRMPPAQDGGASPALPVDIPQFAVAKPNVASGQEPSFPEGANWLKAHGYRTVLHIRAPGEDDAEAQKQFQGSGLTFLSLSVSPQTLTKAVVDEFNRLVTDPKNQPLFVYDKDSSLAGGLWYLHFRLVDKATDEKAREEVARLGFRQDRDDAHRTMWIAVQNFLQNVKP